MQRKNMPGCYCCSDCYEILEEELPCIDPPAGYTLLQDWTGGSCCKCILFQKVYPASDPYWECEDVSVVSSYLQVNQNWLAVEIPPPPSVCDGDCDTLRTQGSYYCCTSEPFVAATSVTTGEASWRTRIEYRQSEDLLQVCVKKDTVICDGQPQLKWIVHARLIQGLMYGFHFYNRTINIQRNFSDVADCFSINDSALVPYACDCELNYSAEPLNADCGEGLPILGGGLMQVNGLYILFDSSYFDYVLFFDEEDWPPESFLLDSSAVPNGCAYTTCSVSGDLNFDDTACIGYSTFPSDLRPCWCDATLACEAVTLEVPLNFGCSNPSVLIDCDCDPETTSIILCDPFDNPWDPFSCGTYEANGIACTVDGIKTSGTCENLYLGQNLGSMSFFNVCGSPPFFVGPSNGIPGFGSNYCVIPEPCFGFAPCSACCHEYGDCQCAPKYAQSIVETTSHTQDFECTWIPWSYCWTRPSITLEVHPCT